MTTRSPRNKTITVSEKEKFKLAKQISTSFDVSKAGVKLDTVIQAYARGILKKLKNNSITLAFLDPPYFSKSSSSSSEYQMWIENLLRITYKKMTENSSIYICQDWFGSSIVEEALRNTKFTVQNRITWVRNKGRGAQRNWKAMHEDIWFATKTAKYKFNLADVMITKPVIATYRQDGLPKDWKMVAGKPVRMTMPSNLWSDMCVPFWSMPENTEHPYQKPEKLLERIIKASSDEGDIVLDYFAGSGVSGVVAKRLRRRFILVEKDLDWCCVAQKRINGEN